VLPTVASASAQAKAISDSDTSARVAGRRRPARGWVRDEYARLPRARAHTPGTLRELRRATSAPARRDGISPPPVPRHVEQAVPAWSSRKNMLRLVAGLARQPYVIAACKTAEIAVQTWRAITINDILDADTRTGRGLRTSQVVAAARVGRCDRTVRRARAVNVRIGILVEVYRGRELSKDERLALVRDQPGHQQRGIPNIYAVTVCPARQRAQISTPRPGEFAHVNRFVHLPTYGGLSDPTDLVRMFPLAAADASEDEEPPPAALPRRKRRPGAALAFELLAHPGLMPLLDGVRPGTIAALVSVHHHGGWHGHALGSALLTEAGYRGIHTREPARNPWALLKALLSAIDPVADVHLGTGTLAQDQAPPPTPQPCGRPGCDGHGWTHQQDGRATKCEHCPPSIRSTPADHHRSPDPWSDDDPPF
jgi:hypothetical protein